VQERNLKTILGILIIFSVVLVFLFFTGFFTGTCTDENCFDASTRDCKPIEYNKHESNNIYVYTIYRSTGENCLFKIFLQSAAPGSDSDLKNLLEGKSMKCSVPKSLLKTTRFDDVDNILSYCHGELKEGIYELLIKRMFGVVIGNINEIRDVVRGVV